jgi:hypothetical protein
LKKSIRWHDDRERDEKEIEAAEAVDAFFRRHKGGVPNFPRVGDYLVVLEVATSEYYGVSLY